MKKLILSMAAVLTVGFASAQSREKGTIELIPQIGYGSANYYGNEIESANSPVSSFAYGVGADYFFNERWSLRSGLLFQTMGTEVSNYNEKIQYLTIPVNANWHFGSTRKWNLNFGPSVGFLLSAKTSDNQNIKQAINSTQIGLNVGIGYKIEVSEQISILIDYQSMSGLTKVAKENYSFRNNYGSFNVGGVFKL